jgi:DNA modification methylase
MARGLQHLIFEENPEITFNNIISSEYESKEKIKTILDTINWDFKDFQTQYLTHKFHSYPARFIPQIPKTFIKLFTKEKDIVVDPMCGCGTANVEAFLNNRNSIGNDFNPLACIIAKVKTRIISPERIKILYKKIAELRRLVSSDHRRYEYQKKLPRRNISNLFNREMINELCMIKDGLDELKSKEDIYELGLVALSSTIWSFIENENGIDIFDSFYRKVNMMINIINELRIQLKEIPSVEIIKGDARKLNIDSNLADLIVTSPPYVNALDYYRVHMYNMLWLGMDNGNFKKHEIGGHSHFIMNRFRLLSEYLGDMLRSMIEMNRILKKNALCVIVVGNSSLEYELIESHKFFKSFSHLIGFQHIKTYYRNIDVTKKYTSTDIGKIDNEHIVVLEKKANSEFPALDDNFVTRSVTNEMKKFALQIKVNPGSSLRGKKVSKERLKKNYIKICEAIETIPEDIKIKKE